MARTQGFPSVQSPVGSFGGGASNGPPGSDPGALVREVQALDDAVTHLEQQLTDLTALANSLRRELAEEHTRAAELQSRVARLEQQIHAGEVEATDQRRLLHELGDLSHERTELAGTLRDLAQRTRDTREEQARLLETTERLRTAREQDMRELQMAEAQFERAADMARRLGAQRTAINEQRAELAAQLAEVESTFERAKAERDSLLSQMQRSRLDLEEMREPLAEACGLPPRTPGT